MKIYSNGRSEIIEQAGRRSFHMGFDIDIEPFGISMEADLSLPTKSNRKISMMTSFNEELYNSATEFLSKVKIYDGDMREFNDDMLVTLVTKMIHNAIQKLNDKNEPLRNIFVKTPKAKAKELELVKEEYLGQSRQKNVDVSLENTSNNTQVYTAETHPNIAVTDKIADDLPRTIGTVDVKPVKKERKVTTNFKKGKFVKPVKEPKENPFYDPKKIF